MKFQSYLIIVLLLLINEAIAQGNINLQNISLVNAQNNKPVSFSEFKNSKGIAIIFTSNYCPYSKLYEDRIEQLAASYANKGIQFVLVNSNHPGATKDDSIEEMNKKASGKGYNFPYLADKDQQLQKVLGASKTPEVYLILPQGNQYQVVYSGAIDDNPQVGTDVSKHYLKDAMEATINGREPAIKNTRAIGCMIKKSL
ncbi:thioredoxin family protein [soil metagenome]